MAASANAGALRPLTAPPASISPSDHSTLTSATPSSFTTIPPVLRRLEDNVRITFEPAPEGINVEGEGMLFVTEAELSFFTNALTGFALPYPSITLHAVSRDPEGGAPCIYCQLDERDPSLPEPAEDEEIETREMRIVPSDPAALEPIFEALSYCASLHPDKYGNQSDEERFDDFGGMPGADDEDEADMTELGRAALAQLESIIEWPAGMRLPRDEEAEGSQEGQGAREDEQKEEGAALLTNGATSDKPLPNGI